MVASCEASLPVVLHEVQRTAVKGFQPFFFLGAHPNSLFYVPLFRGHIIVYHEVFKGCGSEAITRCTKRAGFNSRSSSIGLSFAAMFDILKMCSLIPWGPPVYFSVTSCFNSWVAYIFEEPVNWLFILARYSPTVAHSPIEPMIAFSIVFFTKARHFLLAFTHFWLSIE